MGVLIFIEGGGVDVLTDIFIRPTNIIYRSILEGTSDSLDVEILTLERTGRRALLERCAEAKDTQVQASKQDRKATKN